MDRESGRCPKKSSVYEGPYECYQWHPAGAVSKITLWNMRVKGAENEGRGMDDDDMIAGWNLSISEVH